MQMIKDGYSICFNEWVLDSSIRKELPLLLVISSLTAKTGVCFASNKYFAELFGTGEVTISRWIKKLIDNKYIKAEYEKRGSEVIKRKLRLSKMIIDGYQKCYPTVIKNDKENNISIKNTSIKKENTKKKIPTKQEVYDYALSRNRPDLAEKFYDYFNATDWVDSNGKEVKNWKGKFITWESHTAKPQETKKDNWWR